MSDLPPGTTIQDTYRIDQIIARGGMGEVYRAVNVHTHDTVAIKVVRPDMINDQVVRELFRREAMALRTVRHPAIVGFEGILGDSQGRLYLVMDYVDGPSLASVMRERNLSVDEIRKLGLLLSDGLAAAHKQGVIHRDLAPDNVVLRDGDLERAVIIDFGIAKRIDSKASTLIGSAFAGKLDYCSPEQCGLFGGQVDHRTDIYSLGLTLAAAATGTPIPMGSSMAHAVQARMNLPDLSKLPEELRRDLSPLLQPDPASRLQHIRDAFTSSPTRLDHGSTPTRRIKRTAASPHSSRRIWVMGSVAAVLAALVIGGFFSLTYEPAATVSVATGPLTVDGADEERRRQAAARKAEDERLAREATAKAEADRVAREEATRRAAAQKAEDERLAREAAAKAELERVAREEAARRAAAQKAEDERLAREATTKAERDRVTREEATGRAAAQKAEDERLAREATAKAERDRTAREEAARRVEEERRQAAAQRAEEERLAREARANAELDRAAREEAARRAEDERRQAAEKAAAERAAARRAEEEEAGLRLAERDRRKLQVALTALGHDTQGADGVFGRRSRQMIARWQEREGHPATGYFTAAERDAVLKAAEAAVAKWEADQARAAEQARQARERPPAATLQAPPASGRSFGDRFNNPE